MSHTSYLPSVPSAGRIDIHSHLLPGLDDGCESVDQSIDCIGQLKAAGYTASICTPHIIPHLFPANTYDNIIQWVEQLREKLKDQQIDYTLWPGGEINLKPEIPHWLEKYGVPTLAGSNCVLVDHWAESWPDWFTQVIQWFIDKGYQPILAHPERMRCAWHEPDKLQELLEMGLWLQGNFLPITGEEGYEPDQLCRRYIEQQKYHLMAMDTHQPDTLANRIDGMKIVLNTYGSQILDYYTVNAPRQLILKHLL